MDQDVLRALFGEQLERAGILIQPLHGLKNSDHLLELQLVERFIDVRVGVLADHVTDTGGTTMEDRTLRDLRRNRDELGRPPFDLFGLAHPDIIAYLDEGVIRLRAPTFPGWVEVERRWHDKRGAKLKNLAKVATDNLVTFDRATVAALAQQMADEMIVPRDDLTAVVQKVIQAANTPR